MESPFRTVVKNHKEGFKIGAELYKDMYEYLDKLVIWLMSFAFAAFTLIIAQGEKIGICPKTIAGLLVTLTICIVCGILFRIFNFLSLDNFRKANIFMEHALSLDNDSIMNFGATEMKNDTDLSEIYRRLKDDFGETPPVPFEETKQLPQKEKSELEADLIKHYNKLRKWVIANEKAGLTYVQDTIQRGFQLSSEKASEFMNVENNSGRKHLIYHRLSYISISIHSISFVAALIIVLTTFLQKA